MIKNLKNLSTVEAVLIFLPLMLFIIYMGTAHFTWAPLWGIIALFNILDCLSIFKNDLKKLKIKKYAEVVLITICLILLVL